jgi:hypothetical protein
MRRKISWTDGKTDRGKTVYPPPPSGSGVLLFMDLDGDFLEKEIVAFNFTDFRGEDFF